MIQRKLSVRAMLLTACGALAMTPAMAQAQEGSKSAYNIASQDLGTALTALARQAGREIYFSADLTRGKKAPAVRGVRDWEEALRRVLAGSGLSYRINASGAVVIEAGQTVSSLGGDTETAEIIVTGSNIRGNVAAGSKVIRIDRKAIDESGYGRIGDILSILPQNFNEGTTEGQGPNSNYNRGQEIQLRGLGAVT